MAEAPGFDDSLVQDGLQTKIRSRCLGCGEVRVVSVMDGSLSAWKEGHRCGAPKLPQGVPRPPASERKPAG